MNNEIIHSFKEYQERHSSSFEKYLLEYEEAEEIDFINSEIENYNICLQIANLPINQVFNKWFRIETGTNLKVFGISEKTFNFIFEDGNEKYYYKIYNDFQKRSGENEKKVKQSRIGFTKILNFLDQRKQIIETRSIKTTQPIESQTIKNQTKSKKELIDKVAFKIAKLLAENKIYAKSERESGISKTYYYHLEERFNSVNSLSKHLNLSTQYLNDTFTGANTNHNIFNSKKGINEALEYFKRNSIAITGDFFLKKLEELKENQS